MPARPDAEAAVERVCPHCGKSFTSSLLGDGSGGRPRGFKCPHCNLFVSADRATRPEPVRT